jgi:hypothetical protein
MKKKNSNPIHPPHPPIQIRQSLKTSQESTNPIKSNQ